MFEKRKTPRIRLELKVALASSSSAAPAGQKGISIDVSKTGMLLKSAHYSPLAGSVRGALSLPGQDSPVEFAARVAWSKADTKEGRVSGLEFTHLAENDRARFDHFVESVWTQMLTVY